jgi:hypothetical protein
MPNLLKQIFPYKKQPKVLTCINNETEQLNASKLIFCDKIQNLVSL